MTSPPAPAHSLGQLALPMLIVEDDDGDALLVEELLDDAGLGATLLRVRTIAAAQGVLTSRPCSCVLLDLGLPDGEGIGNVTALRSVAPNVPVVVLTGLAEEAAGEAAVAAGAQDYLVKDRVEAALLGRSIRYAMERSRADASARALLQAEARRQENARLERGLLPTPLVSDPRLRHALRYRPSSQHLVIGGDFYDCIERPDGSVHLIMGDIAGHGPDEAALGVYLRIAWRTMVLNDADPALVLPALDKVLVTERLRDEVFATACTLVIDADRHHGSLRLAGHHPPICLDPDAHVLDSDLRGPGLGMFEDAVWEPEPLTLGDDWSLLLYTDGLIEGRNVAGERSSIDDVLAVIERQKDEGRALGSFLDVLLEEVVAANEGPLPDDVALFLLQCGRADR